jgi:hypothetical protein
MSTPQSQPANIPPTCPMCASPVILRHTPSRYRRGTRVVTAPTNHWECAAGCTGPDGEQPFKFIDHALAATNDAAAAEAWLQRFGEPIPATNLPARKSKAPRTHRVTVLMTEAELQLLDRARGPSSRGEFLRTAMKQAASDPEGRPTP